MPSAPATLPPLSRSPLRRRIGGAPRWRWLLLLTALLAGPARADATPEYDVKAAFLFNFTKFVEWPAENFPADDAPIVIAVLGRNPFGQELENLVRDRFVDTRPIVVRFLTTVEQAQAPGMIFHVLFIAAGEEAKFASVLAARSRPGVLTVGESDRFGTLGGMINFVVLENRVRFEINRAAATAAGLKLSAQLQKLAVSARPAAGGPPR
jgi:hypothetical protein